MTEAANADNLQRLLAATAAGDLLAFRRLYDLSAPQLFGVLMHMLKRRDWAEEALQDCYLKIWQRAETYHPERGTPLTWLMSVARYRALDLLRVQRPEVELPDEELLPPLTLSESPTADPYTRTLEREGLRRLQGCIEALPLKQRRTLLLAFYEGYTHAELAQRMQVPLGTLKSWVRRGLQQLRECLGK